MIKVGYWLASELHSPGKLVSDAKRAEAIGFEYAMISDHYHPWLDDQRHRSCYRVVEAGHRRNLSDYQDASGHHCSGGGHLSGYDARALFPWGWHR